LSTAKTSIGAAGCGWVLAALAAHLAPGRSGARVRRALAERDLDRLLATAALHLHADLGSWRAREHRAGKVFLRGNGLAVDGDDDITDLGASGLRWCRAVGVLGEASHRNALRREAAARRAGRDAEEA